MSSWGQIFNETLDDMTDFSRIRSSSSKRKPQSSSSRGISAKEHLDMLKARAAEQRKIALANEKALRDALKEDGVF